MKTIIAVAFVALCVSAKASACIPEHSAVLFMEGMASATPFPLQRLDGQKAVRFMRYFNSRPPITNEEATSVLIVSWPDKHINTVSFIRFAGCADPDLHTLNAEVLRNALHAAAGEELIKRARKTMGLFPI